MLKNIFYPVTSARFYKSYKTYKIYMIYMIYKTLPPHFQQKSNSGELLFLLNGKISFSGDGLSAARAMQPAACAEPLRDGP